MPAKIALFIDAENISYRDLPNVLAEVSHLGETVLKAVYGDWYSPTLQNWREVADKHSFKIRHQTRIAEIKNSSDMKLIMEAMEVLYFVQPDIFCLVTNDVDYVTLCDKLRESGKRVVGVGYQHASDRLIRACNQFIFIGQNETNTPPPAQTSATSSVPVPAPISTPQQSMEQEQLVLHGLVSQAIIKAPKDVSGWVALPDLRKMLQEIQPGFQTQHYGHATLSKLLQSMPDFVDLYTNGTAQSARLKSFTPTPVSESSNLQQLLLKAMTSVKKDAYGWVSLSALGTVLREVKPGFQTKHYGHANLTKLLKSMPDFVEIRTKNGVKSVRLK